MNERQNFRVDSGGLYQGALAAHLANPSTVIPDSNWLSQIADRPIEHALSHHWTKTVGYKLVLDHDDGQFRDPTETGLLR